MEQNSGHQMNVLMLVWTDYFIEKFLFFKKLKQYISHTHNVEKWLRSFLSKPCMLWWPHVRESKTVLDWIPLCGFQIPGPGFQIVCQWKLERIPRVVFRIPKPRIPNSTSKNFPDSRIRIPFHRGIME